ncbi:AI-2E family transporter [Lederbergia galactosidilytica]|uniref:Membrane protein n=1 Tax=Lederbergia galactosidilytica TaxID=217031 RepID=A0A178A8I9_9BACI|nr:AI-2E family transporter [Lederbergia galactosidilytica]KRG14327.1 membrane protein [Virgibacillus soli]MBP1914427.1 putative PurR-regulated permease PerM [Lederbergia galactosidilytica]OAK75760.1 membrane protein [Lederbergia galactosidilytica]
MEAMTSFFQKKGVKRFIIFALIVLILFSVRSMMNLILLTFIFSFLMNGLVEFTIARVKLNRTLLVLLLYTIIVGMLTVGIVKYLPIISMEISQLIRQITNFSIQPHDNMVINFIESIISSEQITTYIENGFSFLLKSFSDISKTSVQVLIALLLSLFFLLEKPRLIEFTNKFKNSKIAPFYNEIEFFGKKFSQTFGKVIEAQFIIALINTFLTVIVLMILGFPQIIGLAIMIFFLGLIPVAGVIISLVPLTIIAFTIGGFLKVVYLFIAIMVIHAIEAYILNPKLMSSKTDLPVFYTFIVLIFSQNFFGVWGLIIGIPVFVFLLDVLDVTNKKVK